MHVGARRKAQSGEGAVLKLTALGGVGEIGGNKLLLEDADGSLLLDFGISYARRGQFFEEYLRPRTAAGLTDLLVTGVLPSAEGLYRHDLLEISGYPLPAHTSPRPGGVLLSHAHLDHAGHISFLDERTPVWCTPTCLATLEAIHNSRGRNFETEIVNFRPRPADRSTDAVVPRRFEDATGAFEAGGLSCRGLSVDHSMLGCAAYLVRTSKGNILYTGDLRFHGPDAHLSWEMVEAAAREGVWMLISEGTRLDTSDLRTEEDVFEECLAEVWKANGPVVADFAARDFYRLSTFARIASETGRWLVVLPEDALLMDRLCRAHPFVPCPTREPILILKERKRTGTYSEQDYLPWERRVVSWPTARTALELRHLLPRLIVALSFWDVTNLVDLGVGEASEATYIRSASEAHNEEQALDEERLDNWLSLLGVRARLHSHASGHAAGPDLLEMVRRLRPEILVPIHTETPGLWSNLLRDADLTEVSIAGPQPGVAMTW